MGKIMINLKIDTSNNIIVENSVTNKRFIIEYTSKILNAQNIYDVVNYEKGNIYDINSDIEKVTDEKIKDYYRDIFNLFVEIKNELNTLDIGDEDKDNNVI